MSMALEQRCFDGAIQDALSTFVVSANRGGRLWVPQVVEVLVDWAQLLGVHECGSNFGLGC